MGLTLTADDLPARLRLIRQSQRMTQRAWAKEINCSLRSYSDYERGETSPPFDVVTRIARRGGVPLADLVAGLDTAGDLDSSHSVWNVPKAA